MDSKDLASKIAVGTTTWYKEGQPNGNLRARLAEKVIKNIVDNGYNLVVVDGGSDDWFLKSIENSGAHIYRQTKNGMGEGKRECIEYAHNLNTPLIAYMEPEKLDYVKEIIKTAQPIFENKADLVVPDRRIINSDRYRLPSYPTSQENEELYGNDCWRELTSTDLDVWCGPRTWNREISNYFLNYNGKELSYKDKNGEKKIYGDYWDSIFIPVMQAILDGKRVKSIKIDYIHPKEQKEIEEGDYEFTIKRLEQLGNLVPAFTDYWNKHYSNSKLKEIRESV